MDEHGPCIDDLVPININGDCSIAMFCYVKLPEGMTFHGIIVGISHGNSHMFLLMHIYNRMCSRDC